MVSSDQIDPTGSDTAHEAVGVFHNVRAFEAAIDALQSSGFDRAEISLVASADAVEKKLGHSYARVEELEDDADMPRAVYVGREAIAQGQAGIVGGLFMLGSLAAAGAVVASGGTLAAVALAAAAVGTSGGLIGSVIASAIGRRHARHLEQQLAKGGLLFWVAIRDGDHEARATEILTKHGATDVHVHDIRHPHDPEGNPATGLNVDPFLPGAPI